MPACVLPIVGLLCSIFLSPFGIEYYAQARELAKLPRDMLHYSRTMKGVAIAKNVCFVLLLICFGVYMAEGGILISKAAQDSTSSTDPTDPTNPTNPSKSNNNFPKIDLNDLGILGAILIAAFVVSLVQLGLTITNIVFSAKYLGFCMNPPKNPLKI